MRRPRPGVVRWTQAGIKHCSVTPVGARFLLLEDEGDLVLMDLVALLQQTDPCEDRPAPKTRRHPSRKPELKTDNTGALLLVPVEHQIWLL